MAAGEHDLELARLQWRVDALDKWRERVDAWRGATDDVLGELTRTEEIAEAVAEKMSEAGRIRFTKAQLAVAILGLIAAYSAPLIAWFVHWKAHR